ncbi:LysR family transcriptional regulator [Acidovorax carolinensis]|uniref:LysR family transcriptional regulator n=1 Tax=Acidovorax carolinensis TaxID=553814 RepID=A0A240UF80_9BURK|nr:LysR family transcriptional regulator [Acidovorax carolinensis]ART60154.1 LysR family transcriptional regulator [Acidovorax carolinensis]
MKINWSTREVDVFLALADTLSFRRTALQMHLSQSAVSGTLARLEEMLGARLFDRTTRTVQLTQAGEVFAEQARFLRHQMDETVRRVQAVAQVQVGRLALAALPSLAAGAVPRALARFAAEHPGVHLELFDSLAGPAFDMVRAGRVDFALTAANPAYADLDYTPLASDPFVLLVGRAHPLARGRGAIAWADVADLPHISMPAGTSVRQYADEALLTHRIRFAPQYEVEHLATIAAMVAAQLGVSALPELAAQVVQRPEVVMRPLKQPLLRRPIGLVTLRGRRLSLAAVQMVALLRQEMDVGTGR